MLMVQLQNLLKLKWYEHMKFWKIENLSEGLIIHELSCYIDKTCTVYIIFK